MADSAADAIDAFLAPAKLAEAYAKHEDESDPVYGQTNWETIRTMMPYGRVRVNGCTFSNPILKTVIGPVKVRPVVGDGNTLIVSSILTGELIGNVILESALEDQDDA